MTESPLLFRASFKQIPNSRVGNRLMPTGCHVFQTHTCQRPVYSVESTNPIHRAEGLAGTSPRASAAPVRSKPFSGPLLPFTSARLTHSLVRSNPANRSSEIWYNRWKCCYVVRTLHPPNARDSPSDLERIHSVGWDLRTVWVQLIIRD